MLDVAEKQLIEDLGVKTENPHRDIEARCRVVSALCGLLDTRRVLVGDPLPGTLRPSQSKTFDLQRAIPANIISPAVTTSLAPPVTIEAKSQVVDIQGCEPPR